MDIRTLLADALKNKVSDVHFTIGRPPLGRVHGRIVPLEGYPEMNRELFADVVEPLLSTKYRDELAREGQVDFAFGLENLGRFRVNIFQQRGSYAAVMRFIPTVIPPFEQLGLPASVVSLTEKARGLVVVTGPTGSGKTTTLATLIDLINSTRENHIITLEDPIEYLHRHKKSIVNQREIGTDVRSFGAALRASLREDPDVILVGEMRDLETIQTTLTAAETGHLVFATLHTNDAIQTVDRIIDVFPAGQQAQIRLQLSLTLQGVVAQQLVPRQDHQGRVCAAEVLIMTGAARNMIRDGKTFQLANVIQTGGRLGMIAMDASLRNLYQQRLISLDDALLRAINREELKKTLTLGGPV